ncbi:ImmA/IrrE family metallo-endopeptidase [Myxococcus eversor]|uniref:ImmA/IrrE family metallo-endopeptidase n=1 Tax=Myxococcus eversor TaxID=2709661 RepID=UPI0013D8011D|nr:ImmA/IrrE family metallo-endopeptidase [Myxococcus eversor]
MNRETRDAILRGIGGAAEAHDSFNFREKHADGLSGIDVFGVIRDLGIPVAFQALDRLLGACVRVSSTEVGILVTTQRDLHMQRFTAAHELGHFVLEHEGSLDHEVRMPGHTSGRDPREVEADAFAAEFLMPKWLVKAAARRRQWWAEAPLQSPDVVYQLSLRLATSYEATCWGLASHEFIKRDVAKALAATKLKEVKKTALQGVPLDDSWADVWQLRSGDDGARIEAGPNDVFMVALDERASTGFRWEVREAIDAGFGLLDDRSTFDESVIGGPSLRRVVFRAPPPGTYELRLPLRRSFSRSATSGGNTSTFRVSITTTGTRRNDSPPPIAAASTTVH